MPSYARARDRACSCRDGCRATSRTMRTGVRPRGRPALRCAAQSGSRDNHADDGCARRARTWRHDEQNALNADNDARVPARTIARTEQLWRGAQAQQRVSSSSSLYWLRGCSTDRVHKARRDERRPRIGRRNGATRWLPWRQTRVEFVLARRACDSDLARHDERTTGNPATFVR
jgi:hypothetical protein